jgi:hypothetical protein
MPDTLGLVLRDDSTATGKLLEGLAEEEGALFKREVRSETVFEAPQEDVAQPAYRELLEEIEHAVGGFEKSARTHAWLGDAGLNADAAHVGEATKALAAGEALGGFDLVRLVCEAVEAEMRAADAVTKEPDGVLALRIPQDWTHGLEDIPGWDPDTHVLRVTTDPEVFRDAQKRPVGYLGRAHPVVRRALDRVRNIPMIDGAATVDRRVTAVTGDGPALLYTFLCTVRSDAGREYERVIAVRVTDGGKPEAIVQPDRWMAIADPKRQVPVGGLWEKYFQGWLPQIEGVCGMAASSAFHPSALTFVDTLRADLSVERSELDRWAELRTTELCGEPSRQMDLLAAASAPAWQTGTDPIVRLSAFASDSAQPPARRHEASGVVSLHRARRELLDRRAKTVVPPPMTLGLLMIVPEVRS